MEPRQEMIDGSQDLQGMCPAIPDEAKHYHVRPIYQSLSDRWVNDRIGSTPSGHQLSTSVIVSKNVFNPASTADLAPWMESSTATIEGNEYDVHLAASR